MSSGFFTVIAFTAFVSICVWALSGARKKDFAEAAQLPLSDEETRP